MNRLPLGKHCANCGRWELYSGFYRNKSRSDGYTRYCKPCHKLFLNPDYMPTQRRCAQCCILRPIADFKSTSRRRTRSFVCAVCRAEYKRQWRTDNAEYCKARNRLWYAENKEYYLNYQRANADKKRITRKKWRLANPDKIAIATERNRARRSKAIGTFTAEEWQKLCREYNDCCLSCGKQGRLTVDHVVPLSVGGSNYIENIQPLCRPCNSRKGVKDTDYR